MMFGIGRLLKRRDANPPVVRETPPDWRRGIKRRAIVATVFLTMWVAGIEARLV